MKRVAIVGGGIAGLSAAFYLEKERRAGAAVEYVLYESSSRLGGVILTEQVGDFLVEAGPDSFLSSKPWARELCRDLSIEDQLIFSNDSERRTYLLLRGRLVALPEGLQMMVPARTLPILTSRLFSFPAKLRIAGEWFLRLSPRPDKDGASEKDESVASFIGRHFGAEVVERLAQPLLAGVYGGDVERLSVRAVLPGLVDMERRYGSLGRALSRRQAQAADPPAPIFMTLRGGMQQMVDALAQAVPASAIRKPVPVRALRYCGSAWRLQAGGGAERFDAVVLAVPAPVAASLLGGKAHPATRNQQQADGGHRSEDDIAAHLAAQLEAIPYNSSLVVVLGFGAGIGLPKGFGFLVPRSEGRHVLACTFVDNKFSGRAAEGRRLLRLFFGGTRIEDILQWPEEEILVLARRELQEILGLDAEPLLARVYRWSRAMAQYEVGHLARVAEIERLRAQLPGLYLAGNALQGIGVPDCIRSGKAAAEAIALSA